MLIHYTLLMIRRYSIFLIRWRQSFQHFLGTEAALRLLHHAVCFTLIILIAQAALGLLEALRPATLPQASLSTQPVSMPASTPENALASAKRVVAQHLFGVAVTSAITVPPAPKEKTSGPIELAGIIFGSDTTSSLAIFEVGQSQRSYRPGETLPTGDLLTDINANSVILKGPEGEYSLVLRHESDALLAEAPHFETPTVNGITIVELAGPAPTRTDHAAPPPAAMPTLQRLKTLRMKLLGGG